MWWRMRQYLLLGDANTTFERLDPRDNAACYPMCEALEQGSKAQGPLGVDLLHTYIFRCLSTPSCGACVPHGKCTLAKSMQRGSGHF